MARPIPDGANRGSRTKQVAIYLSEEEIAVLDKVAENLGFRSKTSLISYTLEEMVQGRFSRLSFRRAGKRFEKLIEESGVDVIHWSYVNPLRKKSKLSPPSEY